MIFLKLGGSLITDKARAETARGDVIHRMAEEIAAFQQRSPDSLLLIGHGSGSFGHHVAARYKTQLGASTTEDWHGFARVWHAAQRLNRLLMDALHQNGLPAVNFPPSASAVCEDGLLEELNTASIQSALKAGVLPVVHGDVAFDRKRGCTIVSTEQVFTFLAAPLQPRRILLAGIEPGIHADPDTPASILPEIHAADLPHLSLRGTKGADVTGGMSTKVASAFAILERCPQAEVHIFSPRAHGDLVAALEGGSPGTRVLP